MKFIMFLDETTKVVRLSDNKNIAESDLMQMLENMIYLCRDYGIDDSEIENSILDDTIDAKIEEIED